MAVMAPKSPVRDFRCKGLAFLLKLGLIQFRRDTKNLILKTHHALIFKMTAFNNTALMKMRIQGYH